MTSRNWEYHHHQKFLKDFATRNDEKHTTKYDTIRQAVKVFRKLKRDGWDVSGIVCEYLNENAEKNGRKKKYSIRKGEEVIDNKWKSKEYRKAECWKYIGN